MSSSGPETGTYLNSRAVSYVFSTSLMVAEPAILDFSLFRSSLTLAIEP